MRRPRVSCRFRPYGVVCLCAWGLFVVVVTLVATNRLSGRTDSLVVAVSSSESDSKAQFGRRIDGFVDRAAKRDSLESEIARLQSVNAELEETVRLALGRIERLETKSRDGGDVDSENATTVRSYAPRATSQPLPAPRAAAARPEAASRTADMKEGDCLGPFPSSFPDCEGKIKWMANFWKSDSCYAQYGVDGTQCSFLRYLGEVENWCPVLKGREEFKKKHVAPTSQNLAKTEINTDLQSLLKILSGPKLEWVCGRITRMWPDWQKSANSLAVASASTIIGRPKRNVFLHMGLLSDRVGFKIAETAFHGGPLGELVQWSDLIAALHILGHTITLTHETQQLSGYFKKFRISPCPTKDANHDAFHVIFIDIVGLKEFRKAVGGSFDQYRCHFRILDSFGTEPEFNLKSYKRPGHSNWGKEWGNWNMNPKQFWTLFPHSPDNSFLGFVVEHKSIDVEKMTKKPQMLVYGKELDMWKDKRAFIDVIAEFGEVHATIGTTKDDKVDHSLIPNYVKNHGVLDGNGIQSLLQETKVFVGLGFPFEGPAPLEAIANGCFFLNPKLDPPLNRLNSRFFKSKPTLRALTSQHPYAEMFIGKPHVYTIDISDADQVRASLKEMMASTVKPFIPYELTYSGFLERISAYLSHQDFCSQESHWPPLSALETVFSQQGESCRDACFRKDMACQPEFFPHLNKKEIFEEINVQCTSVTQELSISVPSFEKIDWKCFTQQEPMLFSCVGEDADRLRICPCAKYKKGQIALCLDCG
ncbi:alpha-1,6-mannosylglycoprotein 6-beta-N-acetylglucosaminyltransferase A-like isoform X2 [Oscarella lobularis]|uniref:alpha-1,6-mannosylglycoprotein 6-beta-N-acetylglucosaminyltransferase A-like isoform X2 n=1 Tax=Oscarella lobularis TaxID=121494 RepID=UPI0033132E59